MSNIKDLNSKIASKIKAIREQKNLRANAVAKQMNVSPSVLSRIENGEVQITVNLLEKVLVVLETSIHELLQIKDSNYFKNDHTTVMQQGTHHTLNINLTEQQYDNLVNVIKKNN